MLKRLRNSKGKNITIWFEEKPISAQEGESVASALLCAGVEDLRTAPLSGASRAPYCWMGVCFECLLEIDGQPNRQSCLIHVQEGMRIRRPALNFGESA
jgi:predicted molibdopterin-dependent oxidoreductase YjgC